MVNNTFPCNAKLIAWTYHCSSLYGDTEVGFADVWRPLINNRASFQLVHKTKLTTSRYAILTKYLDTPFLIKQGDVIGIHTLDGSTGPIFNNNDNESDRFMSNEYDYKDHDLPLLTVLQQKDSHHFRRFWLNALVQPAGNYLLNFVFLDILHKHINYIM